MGVITQAIGNTLTKIVQTFQELVWYTICNIYILIWGLNQQKRKFVRVTAFVLLSSSVIFVFEASTILFKGILVEVPLPRSLKIVIVILALFMVRHRWNEMKSHSRATIFAAQMVNLFDTMAGLNLISGEQSRRIIDRDTFINKVHFALAKVFESRSIFESRRRRARPSLNLMLLDDDQVLQLHSFWPDDLKFDGEVELKSGVGGAGIAVKEESAVYIPAIKYLQGIIVPPVGQKGVKLADRAYVPSKLEPFRCIFSVPVRTKRGVRGVLNLHSLKQDAFGEFDFEMTYAAASAIGMALDNCDLAS